jgi:AcrR family transcriptional regulator
LTSAASFSRRPISCQGELPIPRPSKPILTRRGIAEAALALVDEEGVGALSTRRLARRLGVEGPSLYNHVASRDDLLDEITAVINDEIDVATLDATDWRTAIAEVARSYRRAYVAHPEMIATIVRRPVRTHVALSGYDRLFRLLLGLGWDGVTSSAIVAAIDYLVLGSAIETFAAGFDRSPDEYAEDYPSLAEALRSAGGAAIDDRGFELGLEALLAHLETAR